VTRSTVREWVQSRVEGKTWYYRAPVLVILAWILKNHLADPMYSSIFGGVNLGFHEAGHAALMWTGGRMWTIAGGTMFELGIPVVAGLYLILKQRDPFGGTVCAFWLGTALVGSGIYAADALVQVLPLVSPFGPVDAGSHDWTSMLMKFGKLSRAEEIGGFMQASGKAVMVVSLLAGSWVLLMMSKTGNKTEPDGLLWDAEEQSRLETFSRGEKVKRPHEKARRKRMTEEERFEEFLDEEQGPP
jgi:hypothetical protein